MAIVRFRTLSTNKFWDGQLCLLEKLLIHISVVGSFGVTLPKENKNELESCKMHVSHV